MKRSGRDLKIGETFKLENGREMEFFDLKKPRIMVQEFDARGRWHQPYLPILTSQVNLDSSENRRLSRGKH